jgi:hypothetical protein
VDTVDLTIPIPALGDDSFGKAPTDERVRYAQGIISPRFKGGAAANQTAREGLQQIIFVGTIRTGKGHLEFVTRLAQYRENAPGTSAAWLDRYEFVFLGAKREPDLWEKVEAKLTAAQIHFRGPLLKGGLSYVDLLCAPSSVLLLAWSSKDSNPRVLVRGSIHSRAVRIHNYPSCLTC